MVWQYSEIFLIRIAMENNLKIVVQLKTVSWQTPFIIVRSSCYPFIESFCYFYFVLWLLFTVLWDAVELPCSIPSTRSSFLIFLAIILLLFKLSFVTVIFLFWFQNSLYFMAVFLVPVYSYLLFLGSCTVTFLFLFSCALCIHFSYSVLDIPLKVCSLSDSIAIVC